MREVGSSFMNCGICGLEADHDTEESTDSLLVLYCTRCGMRGEIEKLRIRDHPVRWSGAVLPEQGMQELQPGMRVVAGRNMAGHIWVRVEGDRKAVLECLGEGVRRRADELLGPDDDEF